MTGRPGDRDAVAKRRAEQIAGFLADAERALAADDMEAAIAACEEVLVRDADHEGALSLLDRVKAIFDEREAAALAQRAEACAAEARMHFTEGRHDQAFALLEHFEPPHPIAREVLGALRAEAVRLEEERLERERLEREHQAELERQHREAERLRLEQEAERLRAEQEAERRRLEEEEAERQRLAEERRQQLAAEFEAIRSDVREGELDAALERLGAVEQDAAAMIAGETAAAEVRALRSEVEAAIAEAERREALVRAVSEHVARAAGMFARRDYAGALGRLDAALALDPASAGATALRARVEEAQEAALHREAEEREAAKREAIQREADRRQAAERAAASAESGVVAPPPAATRANPLEFPDDGAALDLFASEDEIASTPEPPTPVVPASYSQPEPAALPAPSVSPGPVPLPVSAPAVVVPRPLTAVPPPVRAALKPPTRAVASSAPADKTKAASLPVAAAVVGALVLAGAMWAAFRSGETPAPAVESPVASGASVPTTVASEAATSSPPAAEGVAAVLPPATTAPVSVPATGEAGTRRAPAPPTSGGTAAVPARPAASVPAKAAAPAPLPSQPRASSLPMPTAVSVDPPSVPPPTPAVPAPAASEVAPPAAAPVRTSPAAVPAPVAAAPAPGPGGPDAREAGPARGADSAQNDERAVRATIAAYAAAYSGLDVEGVKRVFPSVNEPALRRAFGSLRSQQVEIQGEQMAVAGDSATVSCTLVASAVGQVGAGAPQRDSRRVVFNLVKRNGNWVIIDRR